MIKKIKNLQIFNKASKDKSGAVAVIFALMLTPIVFAVGMGVDYARMVMNRSSLQHALDGAVLAGGAAYTSSANSQAAITAANKYFNSYQFASDLTVSPGNPVAQSGKTYSGYSSLNVTMSATAKMNATFLKLMGYSTLTITATAQAANPMTQPQVTFGPLGSTAADYNSLYMYKIPMTGSGGTPNYSAYPPISQMYLAGNNCNSGDYNYSSSSRCNTAFNATPPANNNTVLGFVPPDQPLGFMFINMNNGLIANGNNGYGANQYGAQPGYYEAFATSPLGLNQPPTQNANNMNTIASQLVPGAYLSQGKTTYPTGTGGQNCALQIQLVTDPSNLPSGPPYPGQCLSTSDPRSGSQYANLSCNQMAGRTFMYWWNDLGGNPDDYNYKDMYYTVKCIAGATGSNGGTISNPAPGTSLYLQLVQ